jgi:hypothetical protein
MGLDQKHNLLKGEETEMAFMADLDKCAELAAQNIWVNKAPDLNSRECVASVKALTGVPQTTLWRRGKKVKGNSILPGTAIATFPILSNGKFRFKGHAAIFVKYEAGGIVVYDQWGSGPVLPGQTLPGVPFHKRTIEYRCSGGVSNDGEALFVIELAEEPSNEPALCSSSSYY